jgi:CRP/FNR family transcriptional regulator, cyclic AMP receptor protein
MDESRLASIPLFAGLSRRERRHVAQLGDDVDVDQGRELVHEGAFAYEFFAIEDGTAEVRHGDEHVADLGPGDFFGEMGLVDHVRRNASVVATSPMTLMVMTEQAFHQVSRDLPAVAERIRSEIEQRSRSIAAG